MVFGSHKYATLRTCDGKLIRSIENLPDNPFYLSLIYHV